MPHQLGSPDTGDNIPNLNQMVEESALVILRNKNLMARAPDGFPADVILRHIHPTTTEESRWRANRPDTVRARLAVDWRWIRLSFYDRQKLLERVLEQLVKAGQLKQTQVNLGLEQLDICYRLEA